MLEVSYQQSSSSSRRDPGNADQTKSSGFQPYGLLPSALRKVTTRRTAIGIPSNRLDEELVYQPTAARLHQQAAGVQSSPPPPLPPKPKIFRAPHSLRPPPPPPPPPPHRREVVSQMSSEDFSVDDYLAPPRPRAVRRSERLNQPSSLSTSKHQMSNISFV